MAAPQFTRLRRSVNLEYSDRVIQTLSDSALGKIVNTSRPPLRFNLKSLIALTAIVALAIVLLAVLPVQSIHRLQIEHRTLRNMGLNVQHSIPAMPGVNESHIFAVPVYDWESEAAVGMAAVETTPVAPWLARYTRLTGEFPQYRVLKLQVNDNRIDDEILHSLSRLRSLTSLQFHNTTVTEDGLKRFHEKCPSVRVRIGSNNSSLGDQFVENWNAAVPKDTDQYSLLVKTYKPR